MKKNHLIGGSVLALSLLFFYGAINFIACGSSAQCRANPDFVGGKVVKALEINFQTETSNGWSGAEQTELTISSPGAEITLPPPPPPRLGH